MDITYWSVCSSKGEDGVKGADGGDRYFSQLQFNFIRVHDNLV